MTPALVVRVAVGRMAKMVQRAPDGYCSFALNETRNWTRQLTSRWQQWNRPEIGGRLVASHDKNETRYM